MGRDAQGKHHDLEGLAQLLRDDGQCDVPILTYASICGKQAAHKGGGNRFGTLKNNGRDMGLAGGSLHDPEELKPLADLRAEEGNLDGPLVPIGRDRGFLSEELVAQIRDPLDDFGGVGANREPDSITMVRSITHVEADELRQFLGKLPRQPMLLRLKAGRVPSGLLRKGELGQPRLPSHPGARLQDDPIPIANLADPPPFVEAVTAHCEQSVLSRSDDPEATVGPHLENRLFSIVMKGARLEWALIGHDAGAARHFTQLRESPLSHHEGFTDEALVDYSGSFHGLEDPLHRVLD